jgi:carbonic anhydrase/acetyltransferase-like protein (isoleucine patch superfamily)
MAVRRVGGRTPVVDPAAFVAGSAEVDGDVVLGRDVSVWYGAVLRGDIARIAVGAASNIQDGCILHTDREWPCTVGERVTVDHGAVLHGCRVEDDALIGMRAVVLNGATVGRGAIVAAGALVPEGHVVPPGTVVMGVPARAVRPVSPAEVERAAAGVRHYVELGRLHAASGAGASSDGPPVG